MPTDKKQHLNSPAVGDLKPSSSPDQRQDSGGEIRQLAYQFGQECGCPTDSSEEDWLRAVREMMRGNVTEDAASSQDIVSARSNHFNRSGIARLRGRTASARLPTAAPGVSVQQVRGGPIGNRPQLNKRPYKADMLEINQAWR
jgi:hypothetical protein